MPEPLTRSLLCCELICAYPEDFILEKWSSENGRGVHRRRLKCWHPNQTKKSGFVEKPDFYLCFFKWQTPG
jgi:hypothetical protein